MHFLFHKGTKDVDRGHAGAPPLGDPWLFAPDNVSLFERGKHTDVMVLVMGFIFWVCSLCRVDCRSAGCCRHTKASFVFFSSRPEDTSPMSTDSKVALQSTEEMFKPDLYVQMALRWNPVLPTSTVLVGGGDLEQQPSSSGLLQVSRRERLSRHRLQRIHA